jgi:hypothetical protein
MMRDPIELLREANPVAAELLSADPVERVHMEQLFERIASPAPVPGKRPKRRVIVAVAIATVALLAGAAAYIVHRQRVTQPLDIGCYSGADLRASAIIVRAQRDSDPIRSCQDVWRSGAFGSRTVPPLVACVLPSGFTGVFPGESDDVCQRLGRPAPETPTTSSPSSTSASAPSDPIELRNALVSAFHRIDCVTRQQAHDIVAVELGRRGMTDWKVVERAPFAPDRPCATVGVDVDANTVVLIPFDKPG